MHSMAGACDSLLGEQDFDLTFDTMEEAERRRRRLCKIEWKSSRLFALNTNFPFVNFVYTPEERQKGKSSMLNKIQNENFHVNKTELPSLMSSSLCHFTCDFRDFHVI